MSVSGSVSAPGPGPCTGDGGFDLLGVIEYLLQAPSAELAGAAAGTAQNLARCEEGRTLLVGSELVLQGLSELLLAGAGGEPEADTGHTGRQWR